MPKLWSLHTEDFWFSERWASIPSHHTYIIEVWALWENKACQDSRQVLELKANKITCFSDRKIKLILFVIDISTGHHEEVKYCVRKERRPENESLFWSPKPEKLKLCETLLPFSSPAYHQDLIFPPLQGLTISFFPLHLPPTSCNSKPNLHHFTSRLLQQGWSCIWFLSSVSFTWKYQAYCSCTSRLSLAMDPQG